MSTRYDVANVPLQGGYVAKQCPVRAQNDTVRPSEPASPDPFLQRFFDKGKAFEADVVTDILRRHPAAFLVEGTDAEQREAATVAAMRAARSPILNARLPADHVGRRVGRPDLLVAAPGGGYRAVDIKWHQSLAPASGKASELPGPSSDLGAFDLDAAVVDPAYAARKSEDDLIQLAHYQRMLEAAGLAAEESRFGAIIGTERRVVWYDLDLPIWRTPSSTGKTKLRSTMERYDFEFAFRLDIVAVAEQHNRDATVGLLVVPVRRVDCPTCPWNDYCRPLLEAGSGDVSLLPRIGWTQWKVHRDHGITDRAKLAALDWRTATIIAAGVDVRTLQTLAANLPAELSMLEMEVVGKTARQVEQLRASGVETAGQLTALDAATAAYSGSGLTALPEHIDLARAALGPAPVYRRRGVDRVMVPRADVEIDIDMESSEIGVYLWGTLLTDRTDPQTPRSEYTPFVTWEPLTPESESDNSYAFWSWLMDVRSAADEQGLSFRAYCYNAGAENQYLRRLGLSAGMSDQVERFIDSDAWVDLLKVWDSQLITGQGSGLKVVAPLTGYRWTVEDASGGESMVRYDHAIDGDQVARSWLLDYNRGDVEATRSLREWMDTTCLTGVEQLASAHPSLSWR